VPFTTLVNPASMMNSRVLSILKITNLESRVMFDSFDDKNMMPESIEVDFNNVNKILTEWREKSINYLVKALN
jgi:hypothetical protein